jgi:PAS domain-containing protein
VPYKPSDDNARRSRGEHHDPDRSVGLANGVSDPDVLRVVHGDENERHDDCSYEQPSNYSGKVTTMNCPSLLGDIIGHGGTSMLSSWHLSFICVPSVVTTQPHSGRDLTGSLDARRSLNVRGEGFREEGIAGAEVTLSVDETYYKGMLDVLPERVIRFRLPDLTILYCNSAWSSSHNLTPAEAIGRTMDELLSPAARADLELQLVQLSPENTLAHDHTARPAPNAPGRWLEWVDQYLPSADGAEVLAVGRDVTDRHIAEMFLADSEARFRELADNSADIVWRFFTEPYPHFDYLSPSIEKVLGHPAAIFLADFDRLLEILDHHGR